MFVSVAHAMGSAGSAGGGDPIMSFMPLIIMLAIFYFLLIRPQQKRAKEHKAMLAALKKGDTVLTNAGFIGRIVDIDEDLLTVDLGETKVQLARGYVAGLASKPTRAAAPESKKDKKEAKKEKEAESVEPKPAADLVDNTEQPKE